MTNHVKPASTLSSLGTLLMARVTLPTIRPPRWTTRRLMTLVALSAVLLSGVSGDPRSAGWHVAVGGGLRAGACRNGWVLRSHLDHGRRGSATYQVGIWHDGSPGTLVVGAILRDGQLCLMSTDGGTVAW